MSLAFPIKYETQSSNQIKALKKAIDKYVNCVSIISIPLVKAEKPYLKLLGANINSILINTLFFGGIAFIAHKKDDLGKDLGKTLGVALLCSTLFCVALSLTMYYIRTKHIDTKETHKEAIQSVSHDISWTNPVGLILNNVVMEFNENSAKAK